jgi:hypothetical protein
MKTTLTILALSAAAILPSSAVTLLTENFNFDGNYSNDTNFGGGNSGKVLTVNDFPAFQAFQKNGGDGIGTTDNGDNNLNGNSTAYFNVGAGYQAAFSSSAFAITASTTELTLTVDLGRRNGDIGEGGRYILGFVNNFTPAATDDAASAPGTSLGSFTLGGTNGELVGAVQFDRSGLDIGLTTKSISYTAQIGDNIRPVLIYDKSGTSGFRQGTFDNVSLVAVPEPGTMLGGVALLGMLGSVRRRKA